MKLFLATISIFLLLAISGCGEAPEEAPSESRDAPPAPAVSQSEHNQRLYQQMEVVEPTDIGLAYMMNGVAADDRFKDRDFRLKGTVRHVRNVAGQPVATLRMADDGLAVQLEGGLAMNAVRLKSGEEVEWVCTGAGDEPLRPIALCREPTASELGE